jgi:ring-1,2-phenylacetyl-CoA epoxidase subunit PaaC
LKEVTYHLRFSSEWMIRLGDGTEESHQKMQESVDDLWTYTGELFEMSDADTDLLKEGISVDLSKVKEFWDGKVAEILNIATLQKPESAWMQSGGKNGRHSEQMGYILTEMQYMQRTYPGQEW